MIVRRYTPVVTFKDIRRQIEAILQQHSPHTPLSDDTPLGANGLGLDSIALVEVLLECEAALGISIAAEMLDGTSLTVGALIARAEALAPN